MNISEQILIMKPPSSVWAYLMDLDNRKDYIPALEDVVMLNPLPIKLGSRYIEIANIGGRRLKTTYEITEFKEMVSAKAETVESIFPIQAETILSKTKNGHTLLRIDLNFKLKGIFKMASRIVGGIVQEQARGILKKVKNNTEHEGP